MVGQTIGHYRVLEQLGEGGTGVVYLAEDTALKRKVALERFTQDRERLARFQREAHVLASLSDPNIAAIYGLEELDDQQILILEFAEAEETLDKKTHTKPYRLILIKHRSKKYEDLSNTICGHRNLGGSLAHRVFRSRSWFCTAF
jgi:serine/threonine protein kinase